MTESSISNEIEPKNPGPKVRGSWVLLLVFLTVCLVGSQLSAYWNVSQSQSAKVNDPFGQATKMANEAATQLGSDARRGSAFGVGVEFEAAPLPPPGKPTQKPRSKPGKTADEARREATAEFDNEQSRFTLAIQKLRQRIEQLEARLKQRSLNRDWLIHRKVNTGRSFGSVDRMSEPPSFESSGIRTVTPADDAFASEPIATPREAIAPGSMAPPAFNRSPSMNQLAPLPSDAVRSGFDAFEQTPHTRAPRSKPNQVPSSSPKASAPTRSLASPDFDSPAELTDAFRDDNEPVRRDLPLSSSPDNPFDKPLLDTGVMPGTDKVPEPPTNTNSFAIANGALIAALHKQFADLRQRVAKAKDDAERSRLEKELVTVTKLASMQIMQLEALLFEPRLRVERFRQAEEQLEKAGVKDAAVLNGFKNEWKRVADSIKQIETRIDEAKAPFFERKIASLPSGDLTLSQFVELVSRQTGITFRLGTAINGEQLVPLRDSHSLDDFLGGLDGQPRVLDNSDLQSVLEMFLSKIQLKHRNEINPETGELICVIVYDKFKFDGVQLDEALQIFVESLGVGYDVEPGVSLDVKVTTDDEGVGRRHLRPLLNTVGLDYRIEASKRLPGGERFRIYPLPSLAPKQEKEDVPEPKPDPLSTGFRG